MRLTLLLCFLLATMTAFTQSLPVGKRTIAFVDPSRSNRNVPTELFYPAASAGSNTPLASGTEKYPVIVFGHGFVMTPAAYTWLADSLVKNGFLVAMPSTEGGFSPSHEQFGRDLAFLAQRIVSLNDSSSNFLFGRVSNKSAVGGHSMGGGCSLLAMTYNQQINAVFNFAAAETNPSAKAAALTIQKPSLLFAGSLDCIVPPSEQQTMYSNVPYACKTFVNVTGGLHCHFGNNDATCAFGQVTSGCNTSSITAATLFEKTISLLRPFLQHYLKADCTAAGQFETILNNLSGITKLRACSSDPLGCVLTSTSSPVGGAGLKLYPNPVPPGAVLQVSSPSGGIQRIQLMDAGGRVVSDRSFPRTNRAFVDAPDSGVYWLKAHTTTGFFLRPVVFHKD